MNFYLPKSSSTINKSVVLILRLQTDYMVCGKVPYQTIVAVHVTWKMAVM